MFAVIADFLHRLGKVDCIKKFFSKHIFLVFHRCKWIFVFDSFACLFIVQQIYCFQYFEFIQNFVWRKLNDNVLRVVHHNLNEKQQFDKVFALFFHKCKF